MGWKLATPVNRMTDAVTGLSDYGFRDYSPAHARFITEDPIRDGRLIVYILVHY